MLPLFAEISPSDFMQIDLTDHFPYLKDMRWVLWGHQSNIIFHLSKGIVKLNCSYYWLQPFKQIAQRAPYYPGQMLI